MARLVEWAVTRAGRQDVSARRPCGSRDPVSPLDFFRVDHRPRSRIHRVLEDFVLTPTSPDPIVGASATGARAENSYDLRLLSPQEARGDPALRSEWEGLLRLADPLYRVFASPTLYEHESRATPKAENRVAVIRDATGGIVGICPIMFWRLTIPLQIRRRILARINLLRGHDLEWRTPAPSRT